METTNDILLPSQSRLSWAGIWSGMCVAAALELLFTVLAIALDVTSLATPASVLSTGFAVWFIVETIVAVFFGAMIAGAGLRNILPGAGLLNGVSAWGFFWLVFLGLSALTSGSIVALGTGNRLLYSTGAGWVTFATIGGSLLSSMLGGYLGALGRVERTLVRRERVATQPLEPQPV